MFLVVLLLQLRVLWVASFSFIFILLGVSVCFLIFSRFLFLLFFFFFFSVRFLLLQALSDLGSSLTYYFYTYLSVFIVAARNEKEPA